MEGLIKVQEKEDGSQIVSARELYQCLGYDSSQFSRWAKSKIVNNEFAIENQDWQGFDTLVEGNLVTDYALVLDFAKRLSMMARTENGEKVRDYFIECEKQAKSLKSGKTELSRMELILLAMEAEKENIQLRQTNGNLRTALDSLNNWSSIIRVAKHNGVSENCFNWRRLKQASKKLGYEVKKAPSPRFDYQNLYHLNAFKMEYPSYDYNLPDFVD